jgi:hypothetical protein
MPKIAVYEIIVDRAEGPAADCGSSTFRTWTDAESHLLGICRSQPAGRHGYDKCDFCITYQDGQTYEGRYDSAHPRSNAYSGTLADHIRNNLLFLAGERCPPHMTPGEYAATVQRYGKVEAARAFLAAYEIGADHEAVCPA